MSEQPSRLRSTESDGEYQLPKLPFCNRTSNDVATTTSRSGSDANDVVYIGHYVKGPLYHHGQTVMIQPGGYVDGD